MPQYCCVPGCRSRKGGQLFPTSKDEQLKWRVAIRRCNPDSKRLWSPNLSKDVVCCDHFLPTDYVQNRKKRVLKSGSTPSIFKHREVPGTSKTRRQLMQDRRESAAASSDSIVNDVGNEEVVQSLEYVPQALKCTSFVEETENISLSVQCDLFSPKSGFHHLQV